MLRKFFFIMLSAILAMNGFACGLGESLWGYDEVEYDPVETIGENIYVCAEYDSEADQTVYTATLTNDPVFSDGTAVTAQDLLFCLYVYLDPGCSIETSLTELDIVGLESYVLQISQEHLEEVQIVMDAIDEAGEDHEHDEEDSWTQEQQEAYWTLKAEYDEACEREFPLCAQAIIDYVTANVTSSSYGITAEEVAEDDTLAAAYAMLNWGYAAYSEGILTGSRSGTTWNLTEGERPTADDFAQELSLAYDGDLASCWAIEGTDNYTPDLPDLEAEFAEVYLADLSDEVLSIEGITFNEEEQSLEIVLNGRVLDAAGTLFGQPIWSLDAYGDSSLWSPETGSYGFVYGDPSEAEAGYADSVILLEASQEDIDF